MKEKMNIRDRADVVVHRVGLKARFKVQHIRKGQVIGEYDFPNGITDVGMNALLDIMFHNSTQVATWYIGLIDNAGFTALAAADTMGSHAGWAESTAYDEAARVTYAEDAASSRAITNSTTADFTINATATLKGIFITSNNTKGGSSGTLWSTASFPSTVPVVDDDVIKITYTLSG